MIEDIHGAQMQSVSYFRDMKEQLSEMQESARFLLEDSSVPLVFDGFSC
jgi:hypothetical protein